MKKVYLLATALAALVSCSDENYVGDKETQHASSSALISFNMNTPAVTRAGGSTAATALDNQFIVWGEKNEDDGAAVAVPSAKVVFPNYQVNWVDHPQSTTSNSSGWEYVGYQHSSTTSSDDYRTNISPSVSGKQTIKYWDTNATNYVFTAVSAKKTDLQTGKIKITKVNTIQTGDDAVYKKGYSIVATADATFDNLYFADRKVVQSGSYGNTVTLNFRSILSQIRVGMYETIPGYAVTAIKFYQTDGETEFKTTGESPQSIFGATVDNNKPGATTITVIYNSSEDANLKNRPMVSTGLTPATTITLGQNFNTLSTTAMSETSAVPTWDTSGGTFTKVFPREGTTTDMTLKVKYTLSNAISGETMDITGTAVVPGEYLQWKPNYKYTYIFKLTDDDLTPITFDAVQIEAENGNIEYITTVDNSAITTYQNGSTVTTSNEYVSGKPIYVVVNDGTALTIGTNAKLYTATVQEGFVEGITENTVANAIDHGTKDSNESPTTWTLTDAGSHTLTVTKASGLETFASIPATDSPTGAILTINGAKFTPTVGTYVFEYTDGSSVKHYKVIKVVSGS